MMRANYPDSHSNSKPVSGSIKNRHAQQQIACDRCRGQKLRCIRTAAHDTCNRCSKAGATCVTDPTVRMGRRPRRFDKSDKDAASQPHQKCVPTPPSSYKESSYSAADGSNTDGDIWTESDPIDEMVDSAWAESGDFGISGATFDGISLQISPLSNDCSYDGIELIPAHGASNFHDFGMIGLEHGDHDSSIHISGAVHRESLASNDPLTEIFDCQDATEIVAQPTSSFPQEPFTKVSNLSLQLRQHLAIVGELVKECRNTEPSLLDREKKSDAILSAIAFMIQGLETFHHSILDILGQQDAKPLADVAQRIPDAYVGRPMVKDGAWQHDGTHPLIDTIDARECLSEKSSFDPRKMQLDTPPDYDPQDSTSNTTFLDVSSSLLVISCYINLIRFCRAVFVCIRGAMAFGCRQTSLHTVSGLEFSGASIAQDPDLQLVVLIQVVIRLVDNIGLVLGSSHDSAIKVEVDGKTKYYSKAVSPSLLDFLLKQEGVGDHSCGEGGTQALREEMRKLNEIVYKSI
ncbi:hypothetical protein V8C35DRAFT_199723 [Trichoderma chlorosporum]